MNFTLHKGHIFHKWDNVMNLFQDIYKTMIMQWTWHKMSKMYFMIKNCVLFVRNQ